jgi:poly-D-alanine transfer protein DltD
MSFAAHFPETQAGDLVFRSGLPIELRRRFARRILGYMPASEITPLLGTALSCLAERCKLEPLLPTLLPLWLLQSLPSRAQDYARLAILLRHARPAARVPSLVNWERLTARSDSLWRAHSRTNEFGIQDSMWNASGARLLTGRNRVSDSVFLRDVNRSPVWEDLDLLLATLEVLGARPIILDTPLKGVFWDFLGVSAAARNHLYGRFDSATARYGVPSRGFREYDEDPNFLMEPRSHLSPKGWAVFDRTINAFYHDSLR